MARSEPFRSLLELAARPIEPLAPMAPPPALVTPPVLKASAGASAPARVPLERRLDAVVLPAGATPPRGIRSLAVQQLVPLRLEAPSLPLDLAARPTGSASTENGALPTATHAPVASPTAFTSPPPLVLSFLDEATRPDLFLPAGDPLSTSSVAPGDDPRRDDDSIRARLRRLRGVTFEATPTRPLPAVSADDLARIEVGEKVLNFKNLSRHGVHVRAFSSNDTDDGFDLTIDGDGFDDPDLIDDRSVRAPAAVAIAALSDEGDGASDPFDDYAAATALGSADDLDVVAEALGLSGGLVVPRAVADDELLFEDAVIDVDDVVEASVDADAGAIELGDEDIEAGGDEASFDNLPVTDPSAASFAARSVDDDGDGFLGDDDVTPARGTPRPALVAPRAVRVVIEDAPARTRFEALSPEDAARSRLRARELYLVALDDLGVGDTRSAVGHLQLAVAYDDETELYRDLLAQLAKKQRRAV